MANEMKKPNSGMPLAIIVGVLIAVVAGGWWFYNSSSGTPIRNTNGQANNSRPTPPATNAPIGAVPPNMLGSPTAPVTVEEFADFQCPSCGLAHPTMKEIRGIYGSRIKFIFRNFPLPMHDKAYDAAVAAEAAGMQGSDKYWAMQNLLYSNQKAWSSDPNYKQVFADYAQRIGLDAAKFQQDFAGASTNAKQRVDEDAKRARGLNVSSTPTVYINGVSIPFDQLNVPALRQIIDGELQKAAANQPQPGGEKSAANNSNTANAAAK
jgi:protein-disulfide isomerase